MDQLTITRPRAGDLFTYPGSAVSDQTWHVAVLRSEGDDLYLSMAWQGSRPITRPDTNNPYRITADGLVDRHGAQSPWFPRAELRQDAAAALVREYEKVPRASSMEREAAQHVTPEAIGAFMQGPLYPILLGIARNGEAGSPLMRCRLALQVLSKHPPAVQYVGMDVYEELEQCFNSPSRPAASP